MTRRLRIAALVSLLLHALLLGAGVGFLHSTPEPAAPDKQAMVELLMVEQKGAGQSTPPRPAPPQAAPSTAAPPIPAPQPTPPPPTAPQPTPPIPPQPPVPPPQSSPAPALPRPVPLPQPTSAAEAPPPPPPAAVEPPRAAVAQPAPPEPAAPRAAAGQPAPPQTSRVAADPTQAEPPAAEQPLEMNLGGTDAASNAVAAGDRIIPASIDNTARNRPPIYPEDAVRRGQQGAVVVLIHVSAEGLTAGADILHSSGIASLDRAARDAVLAWHFLPAVKDGQPVPFDMPMRFVFEFN